MNKSENINELAAALSKAQAEIKPPVFDKRNPHFGNMYASLRAIQDSYRSILPKFGLSVSQLVASDENGHTLETMVMHLSGQWLSSKIKLILQKNDMQSLGSSTTYAKRYAISSLLGITAEEDDDGNAASVAPAAQMKPYTNHAPTLQQIVDKGPSCNHEWLKSKYKEHEEWCKHCKSKRATA